MLHFGTNKQIKFGLNDNFINDYDRKNNKNLRNQLIELLNKFESFFDDQHQYHIKLDSFFTFYKGQNRYYKNGVLAPWEYPNPQLDEQKNDWLKNEISNLIEAGIISKVNEAPKYINSIDVISKNNKFEFNPNFDELNREKGFTYLIKKRTLRDYLKKIIFSIPSSTIFSKLVIKDAAFQFVLDEKHRKYTSFKLRNDKDDKDEYYQFNRLHPNMKVALIHMQMQYEKKFKELIKKSKLRIFSNELLIFSNSIDDHIDKLNQILIKLKDLGFIISLEDSMILFNEIEISEFHFDGQGISLSSKIIEKIRDLDPTTFEHRSWFRSIIFSYKIFCSLSDEDYEKKKNMLNETLYREGNSDLLKLYIDAVNFLKPIFLNSTKINYKPQNSRQSLPKNLPKKPRSNSPKSSRSHLSQRTQSNSPQNLTKKQHQKSPQIPQQIPPQIPQHNSQLHQYLQQNLQQHLQLNGHLHQYLQQQIIQNFKELHLQDIIKQFQQQYQQQIIHQFLQQYQQQYPHEFLNQYLQQNTHLQQITLQFLQQYLQQPNPSQYPS